MCALLSKRIDSDDTLVDIPSQMCAQFSILLVLSQMLDWHCPHVKWRKNLPLYSIILKCRRRPYLLPFTSNKWTYYWLQISMCPVVSGITYSTNVFPACRKRWLKVDGAKELKSPTLGFFLAAQHLSFQLKLASYFEVGLNWLEYKCRWPRLHEPAVMLLSVLRQVIDQIALFFGMVCALASLLWSFTSLECSSLAWGYTPANRSTSFLPLFFQMVWVVGLIEGSQLPIGLSRGCLIFLSIFSFFFSLQNHCYCPSFRCSGNLRDFLALQGVTAPPCWPSLSRLFNNTFIIWPF